MTSVILSGKVAERRPGAKNLAARWRCAATCGETLRFAQGDRGPDEVHRMVVARRILRTFKDGAGWEFE